MTNNEDLLRLYMREDLPVAKDFQLIGPQSGLTQIIEDEEEELIDLKFIIENKPDTDTVREYMRFQLQAIEQEEDNEFLNN